MSWFRPNFERNIINATTTALVIRLTPGQILRIFNKGGQDVIFKIGKEDVTVPGNNEYNIRAGETEFIHRPEGSTHIAIKTAGSTSIVIIHGGDGIR
jgi:hypothetical protein